VFIATWQVPVPLHEAPLHPEKVDPESAAAVSVTTVPVEKFVAHAPEQETPDGLLVTVPVPVPEKFMFRTGPRAKVAVTCLSAVISRAHEPVPVHLSPHPPKSELGSGVGVRATEVPLL